MGVGQRRAFVDDVAAGRLVVGGGRTDIDILARTATEQPYIAGYLFRQESDELADDVKLHIAQFLCHQLLVLDVSHNLIHSLRQLSLTVSTVQQPQFVLALSKLSGNGTTDGACTANH